MHHGKIEMSGAETVTEHTDSHTIWHWQLMNVSIIFWDRQNFPPNFGQEHTHPFDGLCPELPGWAGTRKVKPIWILLKQETASGSGISWTICKSAPRSRQISCADVPLRNCSLTHSLTHSPRQITMPAPHHSVFYRPDALPAAQPTASKHWRHFGQEVVHNIAQNFCHFSRFSPVIANNLAVCPSLCYLIYFWPGPPCT